MMPMTGWRGVAVCAVVAALATGATPMASAAPFAARETHRGLVVDRDGTTARLGANGWFRRAGEPTLVYREGGAPVAGVWVSGSGAVVRSGTTESSPMIGRIVPSYDNDLLRLTIEPAGGPAFQTTTFARAAGTGGGALSRDASVRAALEGSYRTTLKAADGSDAGWLSVDINAEGAARFAGDFPPAIPPALVAATAAAVGGEVDF